MSVFDRVRSLLKSESSQKGKGKGKGKGKNKTFDPQKLYSLYQDHNGPSSEDQVEQVMLQEERQIPSGSGGKIKHVRKHQAKGSKPWNGKGTSKGKSRQEQGKTQPQAPKEQEQRRKNAGKGKQAKGQPSQGKEQGKGQ